MSENTTTNKMTGRKIDRSKWQWIDETKIDENNPQCMEFIKSMEKRVDRMEMEQGRSRSRRNANNEIIGWTMMVGFAIIIGWGIFTAIKSII
jgi:hypothetical protein